MLQSKVKWSKVNDNNKYGVFPSPLSHISFSVWVRSEAGQSQRCVPAVLRSDPRDDGSGPLLPLLTTASESG